eukprot:Skav216366  [mRNA]  locus=scaffold1517:108392:110203:- [translate_table: standard]
MAMSYAVSSCMLSAPESAPMSIKYSTHSRLPAIAAYIKGVHRAQSLQLGSLSQSSKASARATTSGSAAA